MQKRDRNVFNAVLGAKRTHVAADGTQIVARNARKHVVLNLALEASVKPVRQDRRVNVHRRAQLRRAPILKLP